MDLQRVASTNFVFLQADRPANQARSLMEALPSVRVIIQRRDADETYFYLRKHDETLELLRQCADNATVGEAMDLHEWEADPVRDAVSNADHAPDRCVVLADGQVLGYFDLDEFDVPGATRGEAATGPPTLDVAERSVEVDFPNTVPLEQTASLMVFLRGDEGSFSAAKQIPLTLPIGTVLDIIVQARRGFVVEGSAERILTISDTAETLPVQFKLQAKDLGVGQLWVGVFNNGIALGALRLAPTVVQPAADSAPSGHEVHLATLAPISVRLPDLSLLIEETRAEGRRGFFMRLTAADPSANLNYLKYGPIFFEEDPGKHFEKLYADIDEYPLDSAYDRAVAVEKLATKGATLFDTVVPAEARQKLWELRDKISTVIVQSEEPWIPWELCKLVGEEQGSIVEGPFLCEAFDLTRWIPGMGLRPALTLDNIALMVPDDSGLPYAADERNFMQSLASGNRRVTLVPAEFIELHRALAAGSYDGWHFTGHGWYRDADPDRAVMYLAENQKFSPDDIAGVVKNLGKARPLVFLNACQIGRSDMSLTDIGGWAKQFLLAGAGAFVGAYWSVYDQPAYNFAQELYNRLLAGMPIAKAAREARLAIRSSGDPTWLAYTIFADPLATVQA